MIRLFRGGTAPNLASNTVLLAGGGGVSPPLNVRITAQSESSVTIEWEDNPNNDNATQSFTVTREGQPDVVLGSTTLTYTDTRSIVPGITWGVYLTTADGDSKAVTVKSEGGGVPASAIATESGDPIVTESNDDIVTEAA